MIPIPEGSEAHSEEPTESDYSSAQESLDQPGPLVNSGGFEVGRRDRISGACELSGDMPGVLRLDRRS
jgi:hypothetical protein